MRAWTPWHPLSHQFLICGRRATHRRDMEAVFRPAIDMPHVSLAEPYSILQDRIEDGLQAARRRRDRAKDFGRCRLLLQRLAQLAPKPHNLCFLAGSRRTAMAHSVWGFRLTASRFSQFAACSGAPSHRLLQGSGQGIVPVQTSTLEAAGGGLVRYSKF